MSEDPKIYGGTAPAADLRRAKERAAAEAGARRAERASRVMGHPVNEYGEVEQILDEQPAPADPWRHRSAAMRCGRCMYYVAKEPDRPAPELGRCRRHAPTMAGFPAVFPSDWCGDHKLDETKL